MTQSSPEHTPQQEPLQIPLIAELNGSRAEVYDFEALLEDDAPDVAILLQDNEFTGPVSSISIVAHQATCNDGQRATIYRAEIGIFQDVAENDWQTFLTDMHDPEIGFQQINEDVKLLDGLQEYEFHFLDPEEQNLSVTVVFNPDIPHITVHTQPNSNDNLWPNDAYDAEKPLLACMSTVMHVVDWAAGMDRPIVAPRAQDKLYILDVLPKPAEGTTANTADELATDSLVQQGGLHPELLMPTPEVTLADIGGHHEIKAQLQRLILLQSQPEVMAKWGAKFPAGVLIYGREGTGKTLLMQAWGHDMRARVIPIDKSVVSKWIGDSAKNMSKIFDDAEAHDGPVIVLCDEIDSVFMSQSNDERRAMAGVFKTRAADLRNRNPQAIFAATANSLAGIEPAILRSGRFDLQFEVGLPTEVERADILSVLLRDSGAIDAALAQLTDHGMTDSELAAAMIYSPPKLAEAPAKAAEPVESVEFRVFAADLNPDVIAARSKGLTGADLNLVIDELRRQKAAEEISYGKVPGPIRQDDILRTIDVLRARNKIATD